MRHLTSLATLLLLSASLGVACAGEPAGDDGGVTDSGGSGDAGGGDAGSDAGSTDGGDDGGAADAGEDGGSDGGGSDAGDDGGSGDAGPGDGGPDGGVSDGGGLPDGPSSERQTAVPKVAGDPAAPPNGYYEYLPPGYGDGALRPLLVFWHGLGENGDGDAQLPAVLRNGPPRLIDRDQWSSERPFVVLSPQHSGGGCPGSNEIDAFYTHALATYDVDPRRIYLTGLSCGAIGSWNYLRDHTNEVVEAAVLIAGDGRGAWNGAGCDLGLLAIWGFHGDADGTVPPAGTTVPLDNLATCPAPPAQETILTIYPGVGHNSWARTYDLSAGHDIYAWLLTKVRP